MQPHRAVAFVALGANLGPRRATLRWAVHALATSEGVWVTGLSRWHTTEPVGGPPGQSRYVNGVARLETTRTPHELLSILQELEARSGRARARTARDLPRTLDLDLLAYDDVVIADARLELPHPRLAERTFVLAPLCDVAPDFLLHGSGRTAREQLARLEGGRGEERVRDDSISEVHA
jgi:2-amino-4-hydroxy-6-hydroxymethyldihydropteridine diphosphokinase